MNGHLGNAIDWEKILNAIPDAVSAIDAEHRFLWVNDAMCRFLGLSAVKILGRRCFDLAHCTSERIAECPCARMKEGRETGELEIPDRGIRVRITVDPIREEDGTLAGAIHLISDITREHRGIEEHKELSGRLFSLMNNIPGAVYRGLRDWSVTFMGTNVKTLTGYTSKEVTGGVVRWPDLIHPEDVERVRAVFRTAVDEKRQVLRTVYRILHRDGSIRWLEDRRQLLYDASGAFDYVDGLLLDITEQETAEDSLRGTVSQLQAILDSTGEGILVIGPNGKIVTYNRNFQEMWRIPDAVFDSGDDEQAIAFVLDQLKDPDTFRERTRYLLQTAVEEKGFDLLEFRDGRIFERHSLPMRVEGVAIGRVWCYRDITERKRNEEKLRDSNEMLRQSQKMEAVGRLAGGVAHDFNNLLTAIQGYTDLLLTRLPDGSRDRREVEEIRKAGDRAAALTQQLLAFSRKQILDPKVLDLNEIVGDVERMLGRLIGEDIDLVTVLRPDLWNVKADPGQIEQVILNLAVNARDAMPSGGTLTIETVNREIDADFVGSHPEADPGDYVMLAIRDTGIGMSEETKARIFEPFFTTKEKGKGTGLGRRGEDSKGRETVLLVEDEEVVRELARTILSGKGYSVLTARNGVEGIEIVERHEGPIHLLLTDVVMPKMGGQGLAEAATRLRGGMKVLFMTGYADAYVVENGKLPVGSQTLMKPFRVEGLLRKVRDVLDGETFRTVSP